ncbi:hypothetical protein ALSL_1595 [Aerosticca soli]|uniref:Uncharacterized protein n=1 Tax=Aerosticca soli TaxID=2010829 RepID=A0A2Z6E574_9GAMM|nr:hypothetical protein ALSL_1595 [Aerosticca soli]
MRVVAVAGFAWLALLLVWAPVDYLAREGRPAAGALGLALTFP